MSAKVARRRAWPFGPLRLWFWSASRRAPRCFRQKCALPDEINARRDRDSIRPWPKERLPPTAERRILHLAIVQQAWIQRLLKLTAHLETGVAAHHLAIGPAL